MRDTSLDVCRGAIMIYITCFVHLMYWEGVSAGIFQSSWLSAILIEMPMIFYLAGASYSLSSKKSYLEYVLSRIKRVAIPYWEYALFCFPVVIVFFLMKGHLFSYSDFLKYLLFTPPHVPRIFSHIWFVLPYLLVSLFFPLLFSGIQRFRIPFVLLYIGFGLLMVLDTGLPDIVRTIVAYLMFAVWGMYYGKDIRWQNVACLIFSVLYLGYAGFVEGRSFDMQLNKFPPNLLFVSYCMLVLVAGGGFMRKAVLSLYNRFAPVRKYIDIYAKDGYAIYLVHPFSTLLLYGIKYSLNLNGLIAGSWILKIMYIPAGFLFLLVVNLYVLKVYNILLSLFYKMIRRLFLR